MADNLIERLLEIEKLAYMGGSDTAGEIVERAHEAAREIAALREALERLELAASSYGLEYLLDEHDNPELCYDARHHKMIVELADAARDARQALGDAR